MTWTVPTPPPILRIHEIAQVAEHLQTSPMGRWCDGAGLNDVQTQAVMARHVLLAAAWLTWMPSDGGVRAERALLVGNATGADAGLFQLPGLVTPMLGYWLGIDIPPRPRLLTHQAPWAQPAMTAARGDEASVRVGRLGDIGVLDGIERIILLSCADIRVDLALHHTAAYLVQAFRAGVAVAGISATLTEAWLVREALRLHGIRVTCPQPVHVGWCPEGSAIPQPAGFTWQVVSLCAPEKAAAHARWAQLHAWMQDEAGGYPDEALWVGTRDPEEAVVYLLRGHCLSLVDGYVYRDESALGTGADDGPARFVRWGGPVPRDVHSQPPEHAIEPVDRWYWALNVMENLNVGATP